MYNCGPNQARIYFTFLPPSTLLSHYPNYFPATSSATSPSTTYLDLRHSFSIFINHAMDDSSTKSVSSPPSAAPVAAATAADATFGRRCIIEPQSKHTHTAIVLHGRGSFADEFADDFCDSTLSGSRTLCEKLPGWRWVFPSSKELWSTAFQEHMPAWFEAHSLTDPTIRQDLQIDGLLDSVGYVKQLVEEEVEQLGGDSKKLVLGGISQGGATGLWTLLSLWDTSNAPGAFFAASTWLPFAVDVKNILCGETTSAEESNISAGASNRMIDTLTPRNPPLLAQKIPIFIGHGVDDAYVDVELGRQVVEVLRQGGRKVEWKEYSGAEEEGHWFKVPDEMDDIYSFLTKALPP